MSFWLGAFRGLWGPLYEFLVLFEVLVTLETTIQMITVLGIAISFLQDWDLD